VLVAGEALAQSDNNASETFQNLRVRLDEVQNKEAELKIRLEQLDFELKPENIERHFNGYGSTRPEELREARRRQLQIEKDHVRVQLEQLASDRSRLVVAINNAEARLYQQSAQGSAALRPDQNWRGKLFTTARGLIALSVFLMVVGSLALRVAIRRRSHF
jgi:uncharacterized membrane-anchored protein YhcB (DUF1043 family)